MYNCRNQLMDILGSAETMTAHNAVMKTFDFIKPKNIEPLERYLWSVSVGKRPKRQFFHGNHLFNLVCNDCSFFPTF